MKRTKHMRMYGLDWRPTEGALLNADALAFGLSPFFLGQIGTVIAPLPPGDNVQDVGNPIRPPGQHDFE